MSGPHCCRGRWRIAFGISDGQLGLTYAVATLASGFALGWAGRWIDRVTLRRYTLGATMLLTNFLLPLTFAVVAIVVGTGSRVAAVS